MPALAYSDIPDLIQATRDDLGELTLTDLTTDRQEHVAFNRLMRRSNVEGQSGLNVRINIMKAAVGNAAFVGLYNTDPALSQDSVLDHGSVPWKFASFSWAFDEREQDLNQGPEQIQDYVKSKRQSALMAWAEFVESWYWGAVPTYGDKVTPYPLRYWIQKSTSDPGFNGGAPSGYSDVGGISPTTYSRWKNYAGKYTTVSEPDFFAKMRTMARKTYFTPPVGVSIGPNMFGDSGLMFEHYCNEATYSQFETLADLRNDNLGYDFAGQNPTFKRAPFTWVPALDDDSDNPVFSLNWNYLKLVFQKGKWMRELPATRAPNQHNVWVTYVDSAWQMICSDRRRQSVLSVAAANN